MTFISRFLPAVWILAGSPGVLPANAQTTTPISLDLAVDYVISSGHITYAGSGTVTPFGSVTFHGVQTFTATSSELSVIVTFANGDTLQADSMSPKGGSASFTITGGTGAFLNATGSFTVQGANLTGKSGSFKSSGAGSITTPNTPTGTFSANPSALTFSFLAGSRPSSQRIDLNNATSQPAAFSASASAESWLSVAPASGTAPPLQITSVSVTVNPAGLTAGTYTGTVTISDSSAKQFPVAITVTVSAAPLALTLSQTSLRFQAAAGSGAPPSQSIVVLNQGTGALNWSASASTLSGAWLSVSPASGTAGTSAAIAVDPANLAAGDYYGLVQFTADGASNSPQNVVVVLNVLAANTVVVTVAPTGLIFVAPQGGTAAAQNVTVANASNQGVVVTAIAASQQIGLFATNLSSVTVSSAQPAEVVVTPNATGLTPGVYTGILQFQFSNGSTQDVTVLVIVMPATGIAAPQASIRNAAVSSTCSPKQLLPVSTALVENFNATAAWPTALQIQVVDDCGSPMGAGDVVASFSTGDPSLPLTSLGSGKWSATWQPRFAAASAPVVITVTAQSSQPALTGKLQLNGTLETNQAVPVINNAGVVSTASFAQNAPLAPGAFASLFGKNLAMASTLAGSLPLTTELAGAQVLIAGRPMPVQYASDVQINVLIPYDLAPNSTQQIIVLQGQAYSTPEPVTIAPAQPAIFSQDQSGKGAGAITVVKANGTQFSADALHPASAGDSLVIYCSGLGPVTPSEPAGSAAPGSPPAKISTPITVNIGGKAAPVAFAGLTPTYAGLYQVNVTVPSGITPGTNTPVILTVAGLSSPPVTVAIK